MKIFVAFLIACAMCATADARPLYLEESARIANPLPAYTFPGAIALDGDEAFMSARNFVANDPDDPFDDESHTQVTLFRRIDGTWGPAGVVAQDLDAIEIWRQRFAMQNGVAALNMTPLQVFERRNGEWVRAPLADTSDEHAGGVEVDGGRIISGATSGTFQGTIFERTASGLWDRTARLEGEFRFGDDERSGRDVDLRGDRAVVYSEFPDDGQPAFPAPNVRVFRNVGGTWGLEAGIGNSDAAPIGSELEVHGDEVITSGPENQGSHVFRRQASGAYELSGNLRPIGAYMRGGTAQNLHRTSAFVMQRAFNYDRNAFVIDVYTRNSTGTYVHVATLISSEGRSLGEFAISGRTVMADCEDQACFFELPASLAVPTRLQETFSGITPTAWTLSAGSRFTIVQYGASRVLRQTETASSATHTAVLTASDWTNQSIQADVRPTSFAGSNRWVGLATRYRNAANYYYVTLRNSGVVSLRKNIAGVFSEIASAPLAVNASRTYRVRLESIGTRQRVYVDGALLLDADDASLTHGRAALMTFHAAANFDNVVVSPTPTATLYAGTLSGLSTFEPWTNGGGQWFTQVSPNLPDTLRYQQGSVVGDARRFTGVPTNDQAVEVRARATTYATPGTSDRWFGLIARYTDAGSHYYLSVRSGGSVSLRKFSDGRVSVLDTAPFAVRLGAWYRLRLETVGSQVRGYVNGSQLLEATDTSLTSGRVGLVTSRAAAEFEQFRAIQP